MPTHIKAFIVISFISFLVFAFAKKSACNIDDCSEFTRRRNIWFLITSAAFLSFNFWVYLIAACFILAVSLRNESDKVALFILLLFAVPPISKNIPGLGIVNVLFSLNHSRLLSLLLFLPLYLSMTKKNSREKVLTLASDRIIIPLIGIGVILKFRDTTVTDAIRQAFYAFTDAYLVYYVISRSIRTQIDFQRVFLYFTISVGILSAIAIFEITSHWLLYQSLVHALGLQTNLFSYTMRTGGVRAVASTGHSIVLGYLIVISLGFVLYLKTILTSRFVHMLLVAVLCAGSIATLARGPWLGIIVLLIVYILIGPHVIRKSVKWMSYAGLLVMIILATPWGQRFIDLLPFVGHVESENIDYRQQLFENSVLVVLRHPFFGSSNYLEAPEMVQLGKIQGAHLIDITNSYLGIALENGLVGLGLYLGFYLFILAGIYRSMRALPQEEVDAKLIGRVLIAIIVSMLVIIITVSQISFIPIVNWCMAGMGAAYIRMARQLRKQSTEGGLVHLNTNIRPHYY